MRYKYLACAAQSADITKLARACNTMTEAFTLEPCVKLHSAQLFVFFFLIDTEAQHPQHVNSLLAIGRSAWGVLWQAAVFVRLLQMQSCVSRWKVTLSEEGRQLDSCNNQYYLIPFQQKCTLQWCCTNINHTSILEHRFLHLLVIVYFICIS